MPKLPFYFTKEIIFRSPIYPYRYSPKIDDVVAMLSNNQFLESIFIASPLLYEECVKLKNNEIQTQKEKEKISKSLYRYFIRMSTRSTPFGLFSTCGLAEWNGGSTTDNYLVHTLKRHTRLDIYYLHKLITTFGTNQEIKKHLIYYANNTVYQVGGEYRFIEYTYGFGLRKYKLSAVNYNQYIEKILFATKGGLSISQMIDLLEPDLKNPAIINEFLDNLINSQLLYSEFEVSLTDENDFAIQIQKKLLEISKKANDASISEIYKVFSDILIDVNRLDDSFTNDVSAYNSIISKLKTLEKDFDETKSFHIDAYRDNEKFSINEKIKDRLKETLTFLLNLNSNSFDVNTKLESFKSKFYQRYEFESIALSAALDNDIGIGYPIDNQQFSSPLVDDIAFDSDNSITTVNLNFKDKWLLNLLRDRSNYDLTPLDIGSQQLPHSNQINWHYLPPSLSAMFRLNNEKEEILLEGFFGPSASSVMARFTHGHEGIKKLVAEVVNLESASLPNVILAEVVHMPDNRISNVIMHPKFRSYELPYLAPSGADSEHTIEMDDLFLKIQNNELILFSRRLGKRIIPCKTNMHNHYTNSLPIYHFLCDLQNQGFNKSINFSWGNLIRLFPYLPRVIFKNVVLAPAMWILPGNIFAEAAQYSLEEKIAFVNSLKSKYNLPERVLYSEGDNELLIELLNETAIDIWLGLTKNKQTILLKEFLWIESHPNSEKFVNQYIAPMINIESQNTVMPLLFNDKPSDLQRTFGIGSEWAYLKFYCGINAADIILEEYISKVINGCIKQGIIIKWFFIKYVDPDFHIRLRVLFSDPNHFSKFLSIVSDTLQSWNNKSLISKIQPDIYKREIERYGSNSIEICESLFCIDSQITIEMSKKLKKAGETAKILFGIKLIDQILELFQFSDEGKLDFTNIIRRSFSAEFKTNKKTFEKINLKYTQNRNIIRQIFNSESDSKFNNLQVLLTQKKEMMSPLISEIIIIKESGNLEVDFQTIISSIIHMTLNRLISAKERLHEFVLYEFLYKYYNELKNKKS